MYWKPNPQSMHEFSSLIRVILLNLQMQDKILFTYTSVCGQHSNDCHNLYRISLTPQTIIIEEMQTTHGILTPTHLEAPHYSSPTLTYTRLMQSSTRLIPERQPYITQRSVNDLEGASIRRQWKAADHANSTYMETLRKVGKESYLATRQQTLNMVCGNLYQ